MFKVLGKDVFDKLRVKINSITELSCFKEDEFTIHMELENTYIKLIEFGMRPDNLYDVYDSFDNMDIWDIDDMDGVGLKLIIDIFDTMGEMIMGVDMMIVPGYVKCSKTRAYQTMYLLIMSREFLRTLDAKNSIKEKL